MKFSWNPQKAKTNLRKHKVSFEEAVTVFYDPLAKITTDPDHSDHEERLILLGHSRHQKLLFVVHVLLESSETIRIISARKATLRERREFEKI